MHPISCGWQGCCKRKKKQLVFLLAQHPAPPLTTASWKTPLPPSVHLNWVEQTCPKVEGWAFDFRQLEYPTSQATVNSSWTGPAPSPGSANLIGDKWGAQGAILLPRPNGTRDLKTERRNKKIHLFPQRLSPGRESLPEGRTWSWEMEKDSWCARTPGWSHAWRQLSNLFQNFHLPSTRPPCFV